MLKFLKGNITETILGPIFKFIEATMELLVPLVIAMIINNGILKSDLNYVFKMCLVLVVFAIVGIVLSLTAQYLCAKSAIGYSSRLRQALFDHIQSLSYSELDQLNSSTLITRMTSDVNLVQNGINLTLRLLLRSPFVVIGAMVMAFTIDKKVSVIFAITILILSIIVFGIMLISIPLYKKVQNHLDNIQRKTKESLVGARVIRAFCKEDEDIKSFNNENNLLTNMQNSVGKVSALLTPTTYIIINLAIIVLIYTGGVEVNVGNLTQADVVALFNYMSLILSELIKTAVLVISLTKAVASSKRVNAIFNVTSTLKHAHTDVAPLDAFEYSVQFKDVALKYSPTAENSIQNISISAKVGQTIGIIGSTGSGKSSIVNLIPNFYNTTHGEILINGINVQLYSLEQLRNIVSIVPQKTVLFKGTVKENMLVAKPDASEDEIIKALEVAQSLEFVMEKHDKLEHLIEQGGKNLSGGQRQRLTIARALLNNPQILILDDSSSALDYATDAKLRTAIANLENAPTLFIVSQRASSIQYADKIIVMDDGEMVGYGTHTELLESCDVYQEIFYSQFERSVS